MSATRRRLVTALTVAALATGATACGMAADVVVSNRCGSAAGPTAVAGDTGDTGDSSAALRPSGSVVSPVGPGTTELSSPFGMRWGTQHLGQDFAGALGTPIYAAMDGVVVKAGPASGFGNWVVVDSLTADGKPISTVYGHMSTAGIHVTEGQHVTAGQPIAEIGNEGQSTGPHLHFEVWPGGKLQQGSKAVDPMVLLSGAKPPQPQATPGQRPPADAGGVQLVAATRASNCSGFGVAGGGDLKAGSVPAELEPWFRKAGSLCSQIRPPLLAAQVEAESGFRRGLTSGSNAEGLTQFLPSTASAPSPIDGQPYIIDADGNGTASIWDDGDAIIGQGRYMCAIATQVDAWIDAGKVSGAGDRRALYLAAYNAGEGAVLAAGGMPGGSADYENQTKPYAAKILAAVPKYETEGGTGRYVPQPGSAFGVQVVAAARDYLGVPYVWGGGGPQGPTKGGLDCSGLTSAAVFAATGGAVTLPRTSETQWNVGTEIPIEQAQPGDLVFGEFGPNGPGHVGIALGGGQMIHAPQTGDVVRQAPVQPGMKARRLT